MSEAATANLTAQQLLASIKNQARRAVDDEHYASQSAFATAYGLHQG